MQTVKDYENALLGRFELPDDLLQKLALVMWDMSLDTRSSADVARGMRVCYLNPADFGLPEQGK